MRERSSLVASGLAAVGAALLLAACGGARAASPPQPDLQAPACPAAWKAGWQKLADQVHAGVYCPRWMPNPLDGRIGGDWNGLRIVDKRGGYLVSFIYQETGSGEVHVNFHRWPGTAMPRCRKELSTQLIPCYSDPHGTVRANGIVATFYTVSRDADQWHLSYLWHHGVATYVVSEHVAPPYTYTQVQQNLTRLLRSLVLVQPS